MNYSIGEFSKLSGISIHTLRYYEKENLITPDRKENGRRCYTENDITWIEFIKRLKDTGMPIKEIKQYTNLRAQGDDTLKSRMEMLIQHRITILNEIASMQENLSKLDDKIEYYRDRISAATKAP